MIWSSGRAARSSAQQIHNISIFFFVFFQPAVGCRHTGSAVFRGTIRCNKILIYNSSRRLFLYYRRLRFFWESYRKTFHRRVNIHPLNMQKKNISRAFVSHSNRCIIVPPRLFSCRPFWFSFRFEYLKYECCSVFPIFISSVGLATTLNISPCSIREFYKIFLLHLYTRDTARLITQECGYALFILQGRRQQHLVH